MTLLQTQRHELAHLLAGLTFAAKSASEEIYTEIECHVSVSAPDVGECGFRYIGEKFAGPETDRLIWSMTRACSLAPAALEMDTGEFLKAVRSGDMTKIQKSGRLSDQDMELAREWAGSQPDQPLAPVRCALAASWLIQTHLKFKAGNDLARAIATIKNQKIEPLTAPEWLQFDLAKKADASASILLQNKMRETSK